MSRRFNNPISKNLKRLRVEKGYSLEKVSKLADLSLNTVVKIESGINTNPTIETLQKLAMALETDIYDLITDQK